MTAQEKYDELLCAVFNFLHETYSHTTTLGMSNGGGHKLPSVCIEFADLRLWTDFDYIEATAPEYESAHDYGQKLFVYYDKLSQLLYDGMQRKDI